MATDRDDESAQATTPVCKLRRQSRNSAVGADRGRFGGFLACAVAPGDDACVWKTKLISVDTTTDRADASPPQEGPPRSSRWSRTSGRHTLTPLARGLGAPMWAVKPWRRLHARVPCVPRRRAWLKRAFAAARLLERSLATLFFLGRCRFCACAAPRRRGGCVGARRGDGARGARVVAAALAGDGVGQTAQRAQTAGGRRALCRCAVPSKAPRGGEPRANSAPLRCVAGASATPLPNAMSFDSKRRRWRERRGLHTSCVPVGGARMCTLCSALSRRAQGPYLRHRDFGRDPSTWYASLRPRLARARGSAALSAARLRVV